MMIGVGDGGAQIDRAGAVLDGVVEKCELAAVGVVFRIGGEPNKGLQRPASRFFLHVGEAALGSGEVRINISKALVRYQAGSVGRYKVADIDEPCAGQALPRR